MPVSPSYTFRPSITCLLLFFGLFHIHMYGQSQGIVFTRYGIEEGLQNLSIRVLGTDSNGYLWLSDPLTRFDGYGFKTYSVDQSNLNSGLANVQSMTDDGKGNLLFTGSDGVLYYDRFSDKLVKVPSMLSLQQDRTLLIGHDQQFWDINLNIVTSIRLPDLDTFSFRIEFTPGERIFSPVPGQKNLWRVLRSGIIQEYDLNNRRIVEYSARHIERATTARFQTDPDGQLWMFTEAGFWKQNIESRQFELIADLKKAVPGVNFSWLDDTFTFNDGRWWIAEATERKLYEFDLSGENVRVYPLNDTLFFGGQTSLDRPVLKLADHSLVIGSINGGLTQIFPNLGTIKQYMPDPRNPMSLRSRDARITRTNDPNLFWISGLGQGLVKAELNQPVFQTFSVPSKSFDPGSYNNIRVLSEWNNQLLVGSISSIQLLQPDLTFEPFQIPGTPISKLEGNGLNGLAKDRANNLLALYWCVTEAPYLIYHDFRNDRNIDLTTLFPQITIRTAKFVYTDRNNHFWISARAGVIRIPAESLEAGTFLQTRTDTFFSFDPFLSSEVDEPCAFAIVEDDLGMVWVGTNRGLFRIDPVLGDIQHFSVISGDESSLSHNHVRSLLLGRDQRLWIGTYGGGLNVYDRTSNSFTHYTMKNGLPDNVIYSLAEDHHGFLWVGTNKGLCRFDPDNIQSISFTPADGLQNFEFNTNAVCQLSNRYLAFGGIEGFNLFHPDSVIRKREPPAVVLTRFRVHEDEVPLGPERIHLKYDQNFLSFEFAALDFFQNQKNQYAYRLDGVDADWVFSGTRRFASYPNLKPGHYRFHVKAANSAGVWSEAGMVKSIYIRPPWWGTWWFRSLVAMAIAGGVYALYRYRLNQAMKLQHLRNRIAADLHDEIGSTLSSISLAGSVIQQKLGGSVPEVESIVSRIGQNTDSMMEAMSDIVWAVNTKNDRFDNVVNRMRAYAIERLEPEQIQLHFQVDEGVNKVKLDMQQRKNLYLIFKEAVHNAAKYSQCQQVWVNITEHRSKISVTIRDDGQGFELTSPEVGIAESVSAGYPGDRMGGNGLDNMYKRTEELNGKLCIRSNRQDGTTIEIHFPV